MPIRSVVVLGAGTMGAQIAAHLSNAGFGVTVLDISREAASDGVSRASVLRPDPFFSPEQAKRLKIGSFSEDFHTIADADWIVEAVLEQADVKRTLLERVDAARRPDSIVSSNTSGLSIAGLAEGRTQSFRQHFLGTHFFNPPRYLPLLEIIPSSDTDARVITTVEQLTDHRLGKNVVRAKDTPGFIANHVALHGLVRIFELLAEGDYTVEEIDAITGAAIGRPKSATFRTTDIAGLDVLIRVAVDLAVRLPPAQGEYFVFPPFVAEMQNRGWIGEKAGRGFYERRKTASGESEIWTLDVKSMEYRPRRSPVLPALEANASLPIADRMRTLFEGTDRVGDFFRRTLPLTLQYVSDVASDIAYSIDDIDWAMRWGYGWPLGPFELSDALGSGKRARTGSLKPRSAEFDLLRRARERGTVAANPGASLLDIGDGVLAVALHSKMNAIGGDALEMLQRGVREASRNFTALIVAGEGQNFSVGANLMLLLLEARDGNWDDIDRMIRTFQQTTMMLKYSDVPVIAATAGLALGGGCEIALHTDRVQAAAETYIGLVEAGVGLIPAAGGCKEMIQRSTNLEKTFETVGFARVSTCAADARRLGFLRGSDNITMNRDRVVFEAREHAQARVREGYAPPQKPLAIAVGGERLKAALDVGIHLAWRAGRITDHDAHIGRKLSWVLSGGSLPAGATVSEDYLLDLEREAFLSLCGEPNTLDRIQYTLKTGKTLRN